MKEKPIKRVSYRSSNSRGIPTPSIIIQGRFLNRYGFNLGDQVAISYQPGEIIIKKLERG